jgi:hypothetical protein
MATIFDDADYGVFYGDRETTLEALLDLHNDFQSQFQKIASTHATKFAKISDNVSKMEHLVSLIRQNTNVFEFDVQQDKTILDKLMRKLILYLTGLKNLLSYYKKVFEPIEKNIKKAIEEATDNVFKRYNFKKKNMHIKLHDGTDNGKTAKDHFLIYFDDMFVLKMRMFESQCIDMIEMSTIVFESAIKIKKNLLDEG